MKTYANNGAWQAIQKLFVKNAGVWEDIKYAYVKNAGVWEYVFQRFLTKGTLSSEPSGNGYSDGTHDASAPYGSITESDSPHITDFLQFNFGTFSQGGFIRFSGGQLPAPRNSSISVTLNGVTATATWDAPNSAYSFGYGTFNFGTGTPVAFSIA